MSTIKLLDCTLRDGGYINDWKFGFNTTRNIIKRLVESRVDYVEIGFLRDEDEYSNNRTVFQNCKQMISILPSEKGNTLFTAMILHNKYDLSQLEDYDGKTIDAIRVTFHDYDIDEGLSCVKKILKKGYKVFCNPINIMGYTDSELLELIDKVNEIHPYAFSIVDTFGSMRKEDLQRIYFLIEHNLSKDIVVGLHLHENLSLSYSLAQEFISIKARQRECVIDASMQGMGRAPGNLCMELMMDYMNMIDKQFYDTNPILDAIDDYIVKFKSIEPWGYQTAYALSAKYNLHRNYAEYLIKSGQFSAKQMNQILSNISEKKKTAYDINYIQSLCQQYKNILFDDKETICHLKEKLEGRNILLLAPGSSIVEYDTEIRNFISEKDPIIISTNFVHDGIKANFVFFSNTRRYLLSSQQITNEQLIISSNIMKEVENTNYIVNYADLSTDDEGALDNSMILLLNLLNRLEIKQVNIAGFDGYEESSLNYIDYYMMNEYDDVSKKNEYLKNKVKNIQMYMTLSFITPSKYIDG